MRPAIAYFGGKQRMVKHLIPMFPEHETYVDVFGGSGAVLFAKPQTTSKKEIYNDKDYNITNFYKTVKDKETLKKLVLLTSLTPYSRIEHLFTEEMFENEKTASLEKAWAFFVNSKTGFAGLIKSGFGYNVRRAIASITFANSSFHLNKISKRLKNVTIENEDFRVIFNKYENEKTLFYVDPPYVGETRKTENDYLCELKNSDHEELMKILLKSKAMIILSGYANQIYKKLEENNWKRYDFDKLCHAAGKTKKTNLFGAGVIKATQQRIESVWVNHAALNNPSQLRLF